ncbi:MULTISPECIES: excinuclease ABC subunit UvrC [Janibacter]|uniref:UvrABC system protein C n=1 Tax=Janibacter melonis TaxID=262209 RepID=A0A176QBT2_9MICO|nr:excinuclease ABC subunit UvrC [Janibacter melonis]MBD5831224.1 excinuclease ABC subunit UvrC [Janibacter melonis]OAB87145.1 excinuclease ABC subunit C [Janibacter melonis]
MADPATYRPAPGSIPTDPGVYRFRDAHGRVIYVGKAKSLRSRLSSYFQDISGLHPRTARMVRTGASVEWTVVSTEVEALQLEYAWIKEFDPRFNVKYRDDKSYPYLAVTMSEEFPRAMVMRGSKRKGTRYFGPYTHAWAIRETLDLLLRVFPVRTCSNGVFRRAQQVGRPCLLGYIDKCSAPCVGRVDPDEHRAIAEELCDFMAGSSDRFVRRLQARMREASAELDFEAAARLRDDIGALTKALEKSAVVLPDGTDADVFALADDELEVAIQVFHVRGGRIRGQRGWVAEKDAETLPEVVAHLLQRVYGEEEVPREVLVPVLPDDPDAMTQWLRTRRGSHADLRVPQRGDKRALMETVERNATQALARHKVARAGDLTARSQALHDVQEALGLDDAPLRIECFDISHIQGQEVVGSMVVFEDGLPRKSEYRRFVVRGDVDGRTDDTAAMHEVLTRRLRHLVSVDEHGGDRPGIDDETGRPRRFAYPPNLVVVDGGAPQVAAAQAVVDRLGIEDVALVGLAKRLEELWLPGEEHPVILPRSSEGLYLLQRVRDEAHRFAITFHRQRRSKAMTVSALDSVPGLGQTRKAALLGRFGSVKRIRAASVEELAEVPGIGPATAARIAAELGAQAPEPAVDPRTGEVLDDAPAPVAGADAGAAAEQVPIPEQEDAR